MNKPYGAISYATNRGAQAYQEDRFVAEHIRLARGRKIFFLEIPIVSHAWMLVVCDGHGGSEAAEFVTTHLTLFFQNAYRAHDGDMGKAIRETIRLLHESTKLMTSGTTLSLAVISRLDSGACADVAVIGDSPIIIFDRTKSIWVSPEHNARSNLSERRATIARGALYDNDGGYLTTACSNGWIQLSRTLGDKEFSEFLNRDPEMFTVALGPESFVLVASDGLLDPRHGNPKRELGRVIDLVKKGKNAEDLVQDALRRQTGDNATAVLWKAL